jgi:hypothetical protein
MMGCDPTLGPHVGGHVDNRVGMVVRCGLVDEPHVMYRLFKLQMRLFGLMRYPKVSWLITAIRVLSIPLTVLTGHGMAISAQSGSTMIRPGGSPGRAPEGGTDEPQVR